MSRNKTSGAARAEQAPVATPDRAPVAAPDQAPVAAPDQAPVTGQDRALVTAAEWFATAMTQARMYSRGYRPTPEELTEMWSAVTRRDGAAFLHNAAGFVSEHRRHAQRWDLAAIARDLDGRVALYVGGSDEDPYEHRQIPATRERVPQAEVLTFPGGHLTTSEHPDLLAAAIRDVAERYGVGRPAADL
jgi:pimeloyl-ACP methyl ester carboxylesterase